MASDHNCSPSGCSALCKPPPTTTAKPSKVTLFPAFVAVGIAERAFGSPMLSLSTAVARFSVRGWVGVAIVAVYLAYRETRRALEGLCMLLRRLHAYNPQLLFGLVSATKLCNNPYVAPPHHIQKYGYLFLLCYLICCEIQFHPFQVRGELLAVTPELGQCAVHCHGSFESSSPECHVLDAN